MNAKPVTREISLRTFAQASQFELTATLSYDAGEPYEVRIAFHVGLDEPVTWLLDRSLLAQGLSTRAGNGTVQAWPEDDGQNLVIRLSPPGHAAEFTTPAVSIAGFLEATYQIVAPGAEPARTDIDAGIAAILADGGTR